MTTGIGTSIYLNLPVQDVAAARDYWTTVGVRISEDYSDENAVSLSFSPNVTVMLLGQEFYAKFLNGKPIADTGAANGSIVALDAAAQEDVDPFVDAALAAGGTEVPPSDPNPAQEMIDAGLMYSRAFTDPDGFQWEILWMSPEMPEG
jgi:uncharacterized protein